MFRNCSGALLLRYIKDMKASTYHESQVDNKIPPRPPHELKIFNILDMHNVCKLILLFSRGYSN